MTYDTALIDKIRDDLMAAHAAMAHGDEGGVELVLGWAIRQHPQVIIWALLCNTLDLGTELHGREGWKDVLALWPPGPGPSGPPPAAGGVDAAR